MTLPPQANCRSLHADWTVCQNPIVPEGLDRFHLLTQHFASASCWAFMPRACGALVFPASTPPQTSTPRCLTTVPAKILHSSGTNHNNILRQRRIDLLRIDAQLHECLLRALCVEFAIPRQ